MYSFLLFFNIIAQLQELMLLVCVYEVKLNVSISIFIMKVGKTIVTLLRVTCPFSTCDTSLITPHVYLHPNIYKTI